MDGVFEDRGFFENGRGFLKIVVFFENGRGFLEGRGF